MKEHPTIRQVEWIGEILRDDLSIKTKNALGAWQAIFSLKDEEINEIMSLLEGKMIQAEKEEKSKEELDNIFEDYLGKAHEFIKDKILKLDWEEMQELVAGILRAMGYKTVVSKKGPDMGKDIVASPDGLGLEEPRIKVEVKHRKGSMGRQDITSFTEGLRGQKGIYVSTGGFTKNAKFEADRSTTPITLINADR